MKTLRDMSAQARKQIEAAKAAQAEAESKQAAAQAASAAANRASAAAQTPGNRGAARTRRGARHADEGAEDLPALSPGTAGSHPHVRAGAGHGTVIPRPIRPSPSAPAVLRPSRRLPRRVRPPRAQASLVQTAERGRTLRASRVGTSAAARRRDELHGGARAAPPLGRRSWSRWGCTGSTARAWATMTSTGTG